MNFVSLHRGTILLIAIAPIALGALGGFGYLGYQNYQLNQAKIAVERELSEKKQEFASTSQKLMDDIDVFRELLIKIHKEKLMAQEEMLWKEHKDWKMDNEQVDDMCVIGFRKN